MFQIDDRKAVTSEPAPPGKTATLGPSYEALTNKVKKLEVELLHKSQVLTTAKQALKDAEQMAVNWAESSSTRASSSRSQPVVQH